MSANAEREVREAHDRLDRLDVPRYTDDGQRKLNLSIRISVAVEEARGQANKDAA